MKDKSESQAQSSYQVRRDWLSRAATAGVAESQASSASDPPMMQRWMKEPMREQPYNNIGALLEKNDPKNNKRTTREGQTREGSEAGSEAGSEPEHGRANER